MMLETPTWEVVAYSADPVWLDAVLDLLEDASIPSRPEDVQDGRESFSECDVEFSSQDVQQLKEDILSCGYIGADGRVSLFFSQCGWKLFQAVLARLPRIGRAHPHAARHFASLAGVQA